MTSIPYTTPTFPKEIPNLVDEIRLANSARETLLRDKRGSTARVLDAVYLMPNLLSPGQTVTEIDLRAYLQDIIGPKSIKQALKDELFTPAGTTRTGGRGRPAQTYKIPFPQEVSLRLGVPHTFGSELTLKDCSSLKLYRIGLLRSLVMRRPGNYSRAFLAEMLGVSERSTREYCKAAGDIEVMPRFIHVPLTWDKLPEIPTARPEQFGKWIEWHFDGNKPFRVPLFREVAEDMLRMQLHYNMKGQEVTLSIVTQQTNHYRYQPGAQKDREEFEAWLILQEQQGC